jgi:hypothetical protein
MILKPQFLKIMAPQINNLDLRNSRVNRIEGQNSFVTIVKPWIVKMAEISHETDVFDSISLIHSSVDRSNKVMLLTPFLYRDPRPTMFRSTKKSK